MANRLAHEVLGRTWTSCRRRPGACWQLVDAWVGEECAAQAITRCRCRFSRREVRELTGWGDTQLKVHLARLAELEYLLVHRGEARPGLRLRAAVRRRRPRTASRS